MKPKFTQLAKATITENKELVISKTDKGDITISQRVLIKDGAREIGVFLKDSIHLKGKDALLEIRNAINVALKDF